MWRTLDKTDYHWKNCNCFNTVHLQPITWVRVEIIGDESGRIELQNGINLFMDNFRQPAPLN